MQSVYDQCAVMDQPKKKKTEAAITANWEKIQRWIADGYRLPSIYDSLFEQEEIACTLSNFRKYSYKLKREQLESPLPLPTTTSPFEKTVHTTEPMPPVSGIADSEKEQPTPESLDHSVEVKAFDPEAQKRLAESVFRRNRQ
jgi:hypothetical protein